MSNAVSNDTYLFQPYVGSEYATEKSVLKRRLLVLGASHYGEDWDNRDGLLTQRVIRDYLDPNCRIDRKKKYFTWKPTHSKFYKAIIGDRVGVAIPDLVRSIVFYNYLQAFEGTDPNDKHPEKFFQKEQRDKNEKCFERLLREQKPDVVIVWGSNVKNAFPWDLFLDDSRKSCDKQFPSIYHCVLKGSPKMEVDVCFSAHPSCARRFFGQKPKALFSALNLF